MRPYVPDTRLAAALEVAVDLELPLLVTGEPGCGKTQLAYYAAKTYTPGFEPLVFNVKTSSQARDLFYSYDALSHFRRSNRQGTEANTLEFVSFEALGKAVLESQHRRRVVLVDEIDKAPRDFPNDLLFEFEHLAFRVHEATVPEIKAWADSQPTPVLVDDQGFIRLAQGAAKPIIVLTSNSEKNLPDAFLRRVAYFHIDFPDVKQLHEIVALHQPLGHTLEDKILGDAIDHFIKIREKRNLRKKPATAELLVWMHVLDKEGIDITRYNEAGEDESLKALKQKIFTSYSLIAKNKEDLDILKRTLGI